MIRRGLYVYVFVRVAQNVEFSTATRKDDRYEGFALIQTMSSNENLPSLSLSDIMHPMSPSPAPVEDQLPAPLDAHHPRYDPDAQQEPLTDSEVLIIRNRLQELGLVISYRSENEDLPIPRLGIANHLNLREKELIDMVWAI